MRRWRKPEDYLDLIAGIETAAPDGRAISSKRDAGESPRLNKSPLRPIPASSRSTCTRQTWDELS